MTTILTEAEKWFSEIEANSKLEQGQKKFEKKGGKDYQDYNDVYEKLQSEEVKIPADNPSEVYAGTTGRKKGCKIFPGGLGIIREVIFKWECRGISFPVATEGEPVEMYFKVTTAKKILKKLQEQINWQENEKKIFENRIQKLQNEKKKVLESAYNKGGD